MNSDPQFRAPIEQVERFLAEIAEIKGHLRDIGREVSSMERRVRRSFDIPAPKRNAQRNSPQLATSAAAREFFGALSATITSEGREAVEKQLGITTLADLQAVAREVGLSFRNRPNRKALEAGIIERLREATLISSHVNVTPPTSAREAPESNRVAESESSYSR